MVHGKVTTPQETLRRTKNVVDYTVDRFFARARSAVKDLIESEDPRGPDILRMLFKEALDRHLEKE